jgi:hypothetical protein
VKVFAFGIQPVFWYFSGMKPLRIATFFALVAALFGTSAQGALLLQYTFDNALDRLADTGTGTPAPATAIGTNSFVTNTPSGSGAAYSNGAGANAYLTTGTAVAPDNGTDPAKTDGLSQFTVTLWVNLQAVPVINDRLISDWNPALTEGFDLRINTASTTSYQLGAVVDDVTVFSSSNVVPGGNGWAFIAFTYDGTQTSANALLYTGTTSAAASTLGNALTINSGTMGNNTNDLQVGGTAASGSDRSPSAFFDDVRIYDTVLTLEELEQVRLANVPEPGVVMLSLLGTLGFMIRRR